MTDKEISELDDGGALLPTDQIPINRPTDTTQAASGTNYRISNPLAGVPRVLKFPFAFDTPDLLTGAAVYTPTIGDVLMDAWVEIDTAWDGTQPTWDVGTFVGDDNGYGWFNNLSGVPIAMTNVDQIDAIGASLQSGNSAGFSLAQAVVSKAILNTGSVGRYIPALFIDATTIKVCVSQDGTNTGADPGSTQGAAVLYLVVATPADG